MGRSRDIADMLGKTELVNTNNKRLITTFDVVDSAYVSSNVTPALVFYSTLDSLPVSGLSVGQQAYVNANNRLYISDGSGWYSKALITLSPTMTLSPSGTITLATDGVTTSTVTIVANDSDTPGSGLTYSVESDGNGIGKYAISQDSSVFTIRPLSSDSGATTGTFTLTFKTSDGVNLAFDSADFSLTFSTIVDSSAETILLMKAAGNSATNADITYQNSSDVSTGFTETGTPQASTFSPYRSGGYSAYFDGNGDYISLPDSSSFDLSSSDFTIEFWIHQIGVNADGVGSVVGQWSSSDRGWNVYVSSSNIIFSYSTDGSGYVNVSDGAGITYKEWTHVAVVRNGNTMQIYKNGTQTYNAAFNATIYNSSRILEIGANQSGTYGDFNGYIRDVRVVKGTAVYTSNFTPPTEALTAISGTSLLACHLPYFADGSTNNHTFTVNGNTKTSPFGPFDYEPWTADDVGGSVYFGGSGDKISTPNSTDWDLSSGSWTIECWVYLTGSYASKYHALYAKRISGGGSTTSIEGYIKQSTGALSWFDGTEIPSTGIIQPNTWSHCAWVHDGTNLKMFLNGKNVYNAARSVTERNYPLYIGGLDGNTFEDFEGSISDFRITKGTAKYSADFTPPTAPLSHDGSTTKMLMNNKSDANIYDASSSYLLELNGNTISSTTQRKFTTSSSMYFDGTGDYITIDDGFHFGTGDFTFEFWLYPTEDLTSAAQLFINQEASGTGVTWTFSTATYGGYNGLTFAYGQYGSYTVGRYVNNYWPPQNTWTHLVAQRRNGTVEIYVNGTSQTLATYNENSTFSDGADLTSNYTSRDFFDGLEGYVQDLRITKGKARYAGNFTPPTTEFEL